MFVTKKPILPGASVLWISWVLILFLFGPNQPFATAQSQNQCEQELAEAQSFYDTGRFDDAIQKIASCLRKGGLSEEEKLRAYRLLGLTYIAQDYLKEARTAISKLLDLVPDYNPDPIQDPPQYQRLVQQLKEERPKQPEVTEPVKTPTPPKTEVEETRAPVKKSKRKMWYLIGGGTALAGGVIAAILLSGGEEKPVPEPLPKPPALP